MGDTLHQAIRKFLIEQQGFKAIGDSLRYGICPICHKKEAYTPPDNPFAIICPRLKDCGQKTKTLNAFPHLKEHLTSLRKNSKTKSIEVTAQNYLRSRGLIDCAEAKDLWQTKIISIFNDDKRSTRVSVAFFIDDQTVYHCLINPQAGEGKSGARFRGKAWTPPGQVIEHNDELWVTEGILDALALQSIGKKAAASLSATHIPTDWLATLPSHISLVIALDHDQGGRKGREAWSRWFKEHGRERQLKIKFALCARGQDWNDALMFGDFTESRLKTTLKRCLWRGQLAMAEQAGQLEAFTKLYADGCQSRYFVFNGETYKVNYGDEISAKLLINAEIELDYLEIIPNGVGSESAVYLTVKNGQPYRLRIDGGDVSNVQRVRSLITNYSASSCYFYGSSSDLFGLIHKLKLSQQRKSSLRKARFLDFKGYDAETDVYYFPDHAYLPDSTAVGVESDYTFRLPKAIFKGKSYNTIGLAKLTPQEERIWTPPTADASLNIQQFIEQLFKAYPQGNAALVLGYYVATLFRNQFLEKYGYFPILSVTGMPQSGKSTLIRLLNHALGMKNFEGVAATSANTKKGELREASKYSNLPFVMTEVDAYDKQSTELNYKTLFDGGGL